MADRAAVSTETEVVAVTSDVFVSLAYVLYDQDGNVAGEATADEPLSYVHGYAQIVPGLERGVDGLRAGETRTIVLDAEDAFGEPDEKGVFEIDRADLPNGGVTLAEGDEIVASDDEGDEINMRVVEVKKDCVLVDTNHPLAGQTVRFEVTVRSVRPATEDEIAQAEGELQARTAQLCAGDEEHEHTHEVPAVHVDEPLITLRRKGDD